MKQRELRVGMTGPDVRELQGKLNSRRPRVRLKVDGQFDKETVEAVVAFQRWNWLPAKGYVDARTREILDRPHRDAQVRHQVHLIPQTKQFSCWAASTAMMLRSSEYKVIKRVEDKLPSAIGARGGLTTWSRLEPEAQHQRLQSFAKLFGLRVLFPYEIASPRAIASRVRRGPLMLGYLHDMNRWLDPENEEGNPGHMVVVSGARIGPDPNCATFIVHDPAPRGQGRVYSVDWLKWTDYCASGKLPYRNYMALQRI